MSWQDRFSLRGRKALVTGASKGIGAEICAVFADAGADIVALGRNPADLAATAQAVRAHGRRCLTLTAEMASPTEPVSACEQALKD
jgi:NAD(P)-dependent dehydrogenase (short-subunit alcohol dehydrogenase family)